MPNLYALIHLVPIQFLQKGKRRRPQCVTGLLKMWKGTRSCTKKWRNCFLPSLCYSLCFFCHHGWATRDTFQLLCPWCCGFVPFMDCEIPWLVRLECFLRYSYVSVCTNTLGGNSASFYYKIDKWWDFRYLMPFPFSFFFLSLFFSMCVCMCFLPFFSLYSFKTKKVSLYDLYCNVFTKIGKSSSK